MRHLLLALLLALPCSAEVRELKIPIDPEAVGKQALTHDPLVAIEPSRYRALVETIRSVKPPTADDAPARLGLVEAEYKGEVDPAAGRARFAARLTYHVFAAGPVELPFAFGDAGVDSVSAEGLATAPQLFPAEGERPAAALVERKGPITLHVAFSVPVTSVRGRSSFRFRAPDFPVKRLDVGLPAGFSSVEVAGAAPRLEGSRLRADAGSAPAIDAGWYAASSAGEAPAAPKAAAEQLARYSVAVGSLFRIGEETLTGRHELDLLVTRGRLSSVEVALPASFEVLDVSGPQVKDWAPAVNTTGRSLRVVLNEALRGRAAITIEGSQPLGGAGKVSLPFPSLPGAARQQGAFGVSSACAVEISPGAPALAGLQPVDPGDLSATLAASSPTPILLAYRYPSRPTGVELELRRFPGAGRLDAIAESANAVTILTEIDRDAGRGRQVTTFTKTVLQLANASRRFLKVSLDPAARISSCFVGTEPCNPSIGAKAGEFLIPIPRSRLVSEKLEPYPIQLTYQLDLPEGFADSGMVRYWLPVLDVPVADCSWKVFTPERYRFLRFRGELEDTTEDSEFVMVAFAKWLFDSLLYDVAARLLLFAALPAGLAGAFWLMRRGNGAVRRGLVMAGVTAGIVCVLSAIAVPNFRAARERANNRACFANQKTIAGAVEMYNLDNNTRRSDISEGFLRELVEGGYLQSIPQDPGRGAGSSSNYFLTSEGSICCREHGSVGGGGSRPCGYEAPPANKGNASPSRPPRDERARPINFRIPRTGQFTLLVRGWLPAGAEAGFDARYYSESAYGWLRAGCWTLGALLALLLVLPSRRGGSPALDGAALASIVAALLGLDAHAPSLAVEAFGAWATGLGLGLAVALAGPRLRKLLILLPLLTAATAAQAEPALELRVYERPSPAGEVLMRRSNYLELLRAAEAAKATPAAEPSCRLREANYRVEPSYPLARIEAVFEAACDGRGWREIELAGEGAGLTNAPQVEPSGSRLVPAGVPGRYLLDAEGEVTIRQQLTAPVGREGERFSLELATPLAPIQRLAVARVAGDTAAYAAGGAPVTAGGAAVSLPAGRKLRLEWSRSEPGQLAPASEVRPRIAVQGQLLAQVSERGVWVEGALALDVAGRPVAGTAVELPSACSVVDVRGEKLADWRADGQRLWIEWRSPLSGRASVELVLECSREGDGPFAIGLPAVRGAASEKVLLGVVSPGYLQVDLTGLPEGARAIDPSQAPAEMLRGGRAPALLVSSSRPGAVVRLTAKRHEQVKVLTAVADLAEVWTHASRDGILLWRARYLVKNNTEQFLRLRLPEKARVLSSFVSSTAVAPAFSDSGELLVPLEKSGVRTVQAAAFPVEVTYVETRAPFTEGAQIRFTLPKAHLPVSTLRWKLAMPRDLDAVAVATNLQPDAVYREVSYAGEGDEKEAEVRGNRLFEETAPPLQVPFPELGQVDNYSQDVLDPAGAAPFLEARVTGRQTGRLPRSLAFAAAFLMAFVFVLYGPVVSGGSVESGRKEGRLGRAAALAVISAGAVGVTSFRPDVLASGLYFALGLFLGVLIALARWATQGRAEPAGTAPREIRS